MLTEAEQLEMQQLESELGQMKMPAPTPSPSPLSPGLTPEEAQELAMLEQELSGSMSGSEAYARGVIQGLPGVGTWADEIEGGIRSITGEDYKTERNKVREQYKQAQQQHPTKYMAGVMSPTLAMAPIKSIPVLGTGISGVLGTIEGAGASEEESLSGISKDALMSGGLSAATAGIGNKLAQFSSKKISGLGNLFQSKGAKWAENATGATAKQTEKFAENAGEELLSRGLVKFGDTPLKISKRVAAAESEAAKEIDLALAQLDASGVKASKENVIKALNEKIELLRDDSSKIDVIRKLEQSIDDIKVSSGKGPKSLSATEQEKRGWGAKLKNAWQDEAKGESDKAVYLSFRDEVERAAQEANPQLAEKFKEGKETFGLLTPIQEAASRRAAQQTQSPWGGFLDVVSGAGGAAYSDDPLSGAALGVLGRRFIAPRVSSSSAVTINKIGKILNKNPEALGKFAPILYRAQQRGGGALKEAHQILQLIDPEYEEVIQGVDRNIAKDKKK